MPEPQRLINMRMLFIPIASEFDPKTHLAKAYYDKSVYDILVAHDPYELEHLRYWVSTQFLNYVGWKDDGSGIVINPAVMQKVINAFAVLGIKPVGCEYRTEEIVEPDNDIDQ